MKHALVIGGTGMLADVSLSLLSEGYHVSVIARDPGRMKRLVERVDLKQQITPIYVDYKEYQHLQLKVRATIKMNGVIDRVIAWVHSDAPEALNIIVDEISSSGGSWELFHVLGSRSDLNKIKRDTIVPEDCFYYQVQLGFVQGDGNSRWLTHEEISEGVIEAMKLKKAIHIVGQIESSENRP